MKDFNIAKFLKENNLGPHGILGKYVDLNPLKEEDDYGNNEASPEPYEGPKDPIDGQGYHMDRDMDVSMNEENEEVSVSSSGVEMGGDNHDSRFEELGGTQIKSAIKNLIDNRFDSKEIAQFVVDTIRAFKK